MRALGNGPELPGMAGRHCRPSDLVLRIPGQLVDTSGPQERARVPRYSWSNPRASGPGPKTPWTTGRTQGPVDPSARHPGKLFDTAGPRAQSQVTRNSWSTPRASDPGLSRPGELVVHGTHPESPGGAGRPRGHSFSSVSGRASGQPRGLRTRARVAGDIWSIPWVIGLWPKSPRTAGAPHGPSDMSQCRLGCWSTPVPSDPSTRSPGKLFDTMGPRAHS